MKQVGPPARVSDQSLQAIDIKKRSKIKLQDDCIDAFLNKAINIEYVFLILTGIGKIMEAQINKFEELQDIEASDVKSLSDLDLT